MLSAAKHLGAQRARPFAALRVTSRAIPCNDLHALFVCPAALAVWNPGPVASVDAYQGRYIGTRGRLDDLVISHNPYTTVEKG
jgi:hypothetical protein